MEWQIVLRESLLFVFSAAAWITGYIWHKQSHKPEETVFLPRMVGVLFGSSRPDGRLHFRGLLAQLFAYIGFSVFSLLILGYISRQTALQWFGWASVVLALLSVVFAWKKR